ncbi:MAG TPA: hypothetical protein VMV18_07990 [bacterium]|nr:hypothetical protein [bacterium]
MKLSRPAMMSAFLCPGMGQWAAGMRGLGALIVVVTVSIVAAPLVSMFWGVLRPPPCDPFANGVGGCALFALRYGWHLTWPILAGCIPAFVVVYVSAVVHANGLTIPEPGKLES